MRQRSRVQASMRLNLSAWSIIPPPQQRAADASSAERPHLVHERLDARRIDRVLELALDLEGRADHRAVARRELPFDVVDPTPGVAEDDRARRSFFYRAKDLRVRFDAGGQARNAERVRPVVEDG